MANMNCMNIVAALTLPTMCEQIYEEVTNIPFYRVANGYAYAGYLLHDDEAQTKTATFLAGMENDETKQSLQSELCVDENSLVKIFKRIQTALDQLSKLSVTEEVFSSWITFQKEQGDVQVYHTILETLYEDLVVLYAESQLTDNIESDIKQEKDAVGFYMDFNGSRLTFTDIDKQWATATEEQNEERVLNHRNPFADISIREQKFIFGSSHQQFETLGLTTSHTLTKLIKDSEKSYLTVQPGFKIRKAKLTDMKKKQDITFDDTLTTEITQKDENIYVYIE